MVIYCSFSETNRAILRIGRDWCLPMRMKHLPSRSRVVSIVCNFAFKSAVSLSLSLSLPLLLSLISQYVYSADYCDSGTEEHALITSELLAIIHSEKARHERVLREVKTYMEESSAYDFADFIEDGIVEAHYEWPPNQNSLHEDCYDIWPGLDIWRPELALCPSW